MKIKTNWRTLKTTLTFKPDFRLKENKPRTALKMFYKITKLGRMTF